MKIIKTHRYTKLAQIGDEFDQLGYDDNEDDSWIDWSKPCFEKPDYGFDANDYTTFLVYPEISDIHAMCQKYFGNTKIQLGNIEFEDESPSIHVYIKQGKVDIGYINMVLDLNKCQWFINGFEEFK